MVNYGYRRLTAQLKRLGWSVNSKRVRRLIGEPGLQAEVYCKQKRTTNRNYPFHRYRNLLQDLEVVHPD